MELRNIINEVFPTQSTLKNNKIVHQLNNQGCQCDLCQKIVINENKIIKTYPILDIQSQYTKGQKQSFWISFLMDYYSMDKFSRKIRFLIPEICIFEKGAPTTLVTKKKDNMPMKIIKNKQKLNAFEIQNFFTDGYISHNDVKNSKEGKFRSMSREQYYNYWDQLKNECIVLAKFTNGTCQMMNMIELTNLFKSKQKQTRKDLSALITLVNAKDHNQIRVPVEINPHLHMVMFERAKTEVKIINEDIKPKDFLFVTEREERKYEDQLRERDVKLYLEYISIKMLLLNSIKTDVLVKSALFKFIKGEGNSFYLTDIQVYERGRANYLWGDIREQNRVKTSPNRPKNRPSSSPQKIQKAFLNKLDVIEQSRVEKNKEDRCVSVKIAKENEKIKQLISGSRGRAKTGFKLQPIKISKFFMRR